MDASDKAVAGAGAALIGGDQVRRLILQAQAAWRAQRKAGLCDESFDEWRHGALYDAVRKTSFRAVGQREFGIALGHFLKLAGGFETRRTAGNRAISGRESTDEGDRRRALSALRSECDALAGAFGRGQTWWYAESLFEKIHKTHSDQATAKQIWQVLFTLRNRASAKRRKTAAEG
jgi:hypothetical protein